MLTYSASKEFKDKSKEFLLVMSGLAIVMAGAGLFHPYSIDSSEFPTPKRFFLMVGIEWNLSIPDTSVQVIKVS